MGFDDQGIVALSGAHTLGRAFPERSGFGTSVTFFAVTQITVTQASYYTNSCFHKLCWCNYCNCYATIIACLLRLHV
jgi:Peroxidase